MQGSWVGIGILLIVLTVLFGWLGGVVCVLAGLMVGIVLLIVGLVTPGEKKETQIVQPPSRQSDRYCPDCGRNIPFDANMCPYCGKKFGDKFPTDENVKTENFVKEVEKNQEEKKMKSCPSCGYENKSNSKFCKKCGTKLGE